MKDISKIYIVRRNSDGKLMRSNNKNVFVSLAHIKSSSLWGCIRDSSCTVYEYNLAQILPIEIDLNEIR